MADEKKMDFEGYCVKCRAKHDIKDGVVGETANGRIMVQGVCPECRSQPDAYAELHPSYPECA